MPERPIGQRTIAGLDDTREGHSRGVEFGQRAGHALAIRSITRLLRKWRHDAGGESGLELQPVTVGAHRHLRSAERIARLHPCAIARESIDRPVSGRRKIHLEVAGLTIKGDERFEAGMFP